jgi:hypothetical protein
MRVFSCLAVVLFASSVLCAEGRAAGPSPEEQKEGFVSLFDGKSLDGWVDTDGYTAQDGILACNAAPGGKNAKRIHAKKEYANFIFRFEFKLTPGANNGVGIRSPMTANPAYTGMEIQILDNGNPKYANLQPYQAHGSIYGVVPAKRGFLKPVGQWNSEEILADGPHIKVTLNGTVIVDADLSKIGDETPDHKAHPGLHNAKGYIGFLGHGSSLEFRNIRIKELKE